MCFLPTGFQVLPCIQIMKAELNCQFSEISRGKTERCRLVGIAFSQMQSDSYELVIKEKVA